jgi:small-conductance mechanosensitive channel
MGRNGIRVGDWVEMGVGGEVVEIGLLRTVLLETGNWTDSGHPTGRKVAFVNSFAIEGHFFNFSTSGQWLWDELQVMIPAGLEPYAIIASIKEIVGRATEHNHQLAEQEWLRVTKQYGMRPLPLAPAIDVKPTSGGVEVLIRYLTRAHERYDLKSRVYQQLVALLHGRGSLEEGSATKALGAAAHGS